MDGQTEIHEVTLFLTDEEVTMLEELASELTRDFDLARGLASFSDRGLLGVMQLYGDIREAVGKARG